MFNDLTEFFGGCSMENNSVMGRWEDPVSSRIYDDENMTYHIICEKTVRNIKSIKEYKKKLKKDFCQEAIMIYYINVYRF